MRYVFLSVIMFSCFCGVSQKAVANDWVPIEQSETVNKQPRTVLFIGNSYTYYNDLDTVLKNMAASAKPPVKLLTARLVKGGATLDDHYSDPKTKTVMSKLKWDLVVLQEQSMRPVVDRAAFFESARKLGKLIEDHKSKPVLFMTWAREHKPEMTEPLSSAYTQIGKELDAYVAPAGLAWAACLKANPSVRLYDEDESHPSAYGTYLTACVFYATLTGQSPEGLSNGGLKEVTAEKAELFQEIAWRTVSAYVKENSSKTIKH